MPIYYGLVAKQIGQNNVMLADFTAYVGNFHQIT